MNGDAKRWHVVVTRSRAEWKVWTTLINRPYGIHAFYPHTLRDRHIGNGNTEGRTTPLFPGYVFALIRTRQVSLIAQIPKVAAILRTGLEYVTLDEREKLRIQKMCTRLYYDAVLSPYARKVYEPGMLVSVPHGELAGLPAWVEGIDKSGRVEATLGNLKLSFRVEPLSREVHSNEEIPISRAV